jgi:hypothetical protein
MVDGLQTVENIDYILPESVSRKFKVKAKPDLIQRGLANNLIQTTTPPIISMSNGLALRILIPATHVATNLGINDELARWNES